MELSELAKSTLASYVRKASRRAGDHDYASGMMDAVGDRKSAKIHSSQGNKRRKGIDMAVRKLGEDWVDDVGKAADGTLNRIKNLRRKKRNGDVKLEPTFEETDWDPETRTKREVSHYNIINHRSGDVVGKAKTKKGARRSVDTHDNNYGGYAHRAVPVFKEESMNEGTHYHSVFFKHDGKWKHHFDADNKEDARDEQRSLKDSGEKHVKVLRVPKSEANWNKRDPHEYVTSHLKEEIIMEDGKFAPRKLKDIAPKPSKKYNEYKGSTPDERAIIKRYEDNTVVWPDRNGNGDDVFTGSKQKRAEKPLVPGDDEKKYAEWNKDVPVVENFEFEIDFESMSEEEAKEYVESILEEDSSHLKAVPIGAHHLDMHWATQHVAPQGSHIKVGREGVSIHHPDGSVHHVHGGHVHQDDVKYGSGNRHAEHGKFVVSKHTNEGSGFVSQKKNGRFGYTNRTHDESKAKEFKSREHAVNHINYHSQHDSQLGTRYAIHPKRSGAKVKADRARYAKARVEYGNAVRSSKHMDDQRDPSVQRAKAKMMKHVHPALR